jgi:hypothetical protein
MCGEDDGECDDGIICDGCDRVYHRECLMYEGYDFDDSVIDNSDDWF